MAVDIESIQCQLKNLRSIFFLAVFRESPKKIENQVKTQLICTLERTNSKYLRQYFNSVIALNTVANDYGLPRESIIF